MRTLSKKGQLNTLGTTMIALVLASALLIFGLIIIQETNETAVISKAVSESYANESITSLTDVIGGGHALDCTGFPASICSIIAVVNATGNETLVSTNYTESACTLYAVGITYNATPVKVNYGCTHGGEAYISGNLTVAGLGAFGSFWEIIVLAIVISIVIGLLLLVFGGSQRR